ncbi:MAG: hypothetical protein SGPRY_010925 [Prymnesium sp.]
MAPRRLSAFEAAMASGGLEELCDTPSLISCAIHLSRLPSRPALLSLIREHLLSFDSLASRPEKGKWAPVEPFDEEKHVFFSEIASEADLLPWLDACVVKPLVNKANGPWWEMFAITVKSSGKGVLVFRMDHACADGIALTQVLTRVATLSDGSPLKARDYTKREGKPMDFCASLCSGVKNAFKYTVLPFGKFDSDLPFMPCAHPFAARRAALSSRSVGG